MQRQTRRERNYFNEQATLGSVVLNNDSFAEVVQILGSTADMFDEQHHKQLWNAMVQLSAERRPIDYITLSDICRDMSATQISTLDDAVPHSSKATDYAELVRDSYVARKMHAHASKIKRLFEEDKLSRKAMEDEHLAMNALFRSKASRGIESISDILPRVMEDIERSLRDPGSVESIRTGIPALDKILDCLRPDTLNIIGARPSVGKSGLAANIAINAARVGYPVLFFSLEMGGKSIVKRLMSIDQGVPFKTLAGSFAEGVQKKRLESARLNFLKMNLHISNPGSLDIHRFRSDAKKFAAQHEKMPLIILDYLQLASVDGSKKNSSRYDQIGEFTREAKLLAGELHCPVVLLCQLSREADDKDDPSACMPYMRESGNIEQDADVVIVMLRKLNPKLAQVVYGDSKAGIKPCVLPELAGNVVNCAVIKNRDYETGPCALYFEKPTQRIVSLEGFIRGELNDGGIDDAKDDPTYNPLPEYDYEEDDTPF
jgi:replicative DNA helicase